MRDFLPMLDDSKWFSASAQSRLADSLDSLQKLLPSTDKSIDKSTDTPTEKPADNSNQISNLNLPFDDASSDNKLGEEEEIDFTSGRVFDLLKEYTLALESINQHTNFVKCEGEQFVRDHLLDALSAGHVLARRENHCRTMMDIGSGGGLPGIPLAILFQERQFFLVERKKKRADFLRYVTHRLKMERRVKVLECDLREVEERVDQVILRAFLPLTPTSWRLIQSPLLPSGKVHFYKGKKESIQGELNSLNGLYSQCEMTVLPSFSKESKERHLLTLSPQKR